MTCTGQLPDPPEQIRITLPAGMELVSAPNPIGVVGTDFSAVQSIMAQLGPALAALQPILRIIDAVTSLFEVLKKAPEIPVDPAGFIESLEEATVKIAKLSTLVPQLSVPAMVITTIGACAKYLTAIIGQLSSIAAAGAAAQEVMDQAVAAGDVQLQTEAQCSLDNVAKLTEHAGAAMGPVVGILTSITSMLSFLPAPVELPGIPDVTGMAAQEMVDALQPIVAVLEAISL